MDLEQQSSFHWKILLLVSLRDLKVLELDNSNNNNDGNNELGNDNNELDNNNNKLNKEVTYHKILMERKCKDPVLSSQS